MEDSPPPVPPKDAAYCQPRVDPDTIHVAPPGGSKRKRDTHDHDTPIHLRNGHLDVTDPDAHTPKRSRSHLPPSDADVSDDFATPGLRRKKKVGNLSNMSLRHAAQRQSQLQQRESRFQEGSLTDKPSEQPPTAFTRRNRIGSGDVRQIEELMADYHDGVDTPRGSVELQVEDEKRQMASRVRAITAESARREEGSGGLFRFGRSLAANFHPLTLWNKLWNETKEELIRQNMEEAERKARMKAEAEAKYAQLKAAGQLGLQSIGNLSSDARVSNEGSKARDSGIELETSHVSHRHQRTAGSQLLPPQNDTTDRSPSQVPESELKPSKTLRSRFHFKRPSISNLKNDIKRVKSDFNLTATVNGDPSSSVSPAKGDVSETSALKRSLSKFDLKKTHKLSKRVSDLEAKLGLARRELDEALVEASPMPMLGGRYERFTPQSTIRRPKFVPGKLPTLPSERLMNLDGLDFGDDTPKPRKAMDLTEELDVDGLNDDDTMRVRSERPYPPRAASLFSLPATNNEQQQQLTDTSANIGQAITSDLTQLNTSEVNDMDPNTIPIVASADAPDSTQTTNYSDLDAKLKALDANVKITQKSTKTKKRKSGIDDEDRAFKPGQDADEEEEEDWDGGVEKPKKKRKSAGGKTDGGGLQSNKRAAKRQTQGSPQSGKKAVGRVGKKKAKSAAKTEEEQDVNDQAVLDDATTANAADLASRTSLDSQGQPLQPLYEEQDEISIVPLKSAPVDPTARATPARYAGNLEERAGEGEETVITRSVVREGIVLDGREEFQWPDDVF